MLAHSVDCRNLGLNRSNTATVIYSTVSTSWHQPYAVIVWIDLFNAVCSGPVLIEMFYLQI